MTEEQIYETVTVIIRDVLDREDVTAHAELSAHDIDEWDSFNHINIIVAVEAEYGIRFSTAEVESFQTVGGMVRIIAERASG